MDTEPVIELLKSVTDLSTGFIHELKAGILIEHYKAHQIILAEGQVENRLWFLQNGLVRSYFYDVHGVEHTLRFWVSGEIIFSYAGFWKQPSTAYLEILEDSTLISYTYDNLEVLKTKHKEIFIIISTIVRRFHQQEDRRTQLYNHSAEERYLQLRKENPALFRTVPIKIIASYLHMSRETLTRLIGKH
jgi:CRP-like cAMP-binding protein